MEAREGKDGRDGNKMAVGSNLLNIGSFNEGAAPGGNVRKSTSFKNYIVSGI